jgi:hypothetical protein
VELRFQIWQRYLLLPIILGFSIDYVRIFTMKKFLPVIIGLPVTLVATTPYQPTQAQTFAAPPQNCIYLKEVTTGRPTVRKVIARGNTNANTDFAVPTGTRFTNYIGKLIPENNETYVAEANLKYNDGSSSQAVKRTIQARRLFLYQQPFRTPTAKQPFQIIAVLSWVRYSNSN